MNDDNFTNDHKLELEYVFGLFDSDKDGLLNKSWIFFKELSFIFKTLFLWILLILIADLKKVFNAIGGDNRKRMSLKDKTNQFVHGATGDGM